MRETRFHVSFKKPSNPGKDLGSLAMRIRGETCRNPDPFRDRILREIRFHVSFRNPSNPPEKKAIPGKILARNWKELGKKC